MSQVYSKGTVKVVWIQDDPEKIYSKMFDNEVEAKKFGKNKKDHLIFKLVKQKEMREFTWELMPYGNHKAYSLLFTAYKKGLLKIPGRKS